MKKRILFILHYPPPIHGSSSIGQYIKESEIINSNYSCRYINLGTSRNISNIGKFQIYKILLYFNIIYKTIKSFLYFKPELLYLAITIRGVGFYKDSIIALIAKIFKVKIVFHLHNKGINYDKRSVLIKLYYRYIFRNSNVILLSKELYKDVEGIVSEQNVYYCSNGIPKNINNLTIENNKDSCIKILFLSNLIESKGIFVLLKACSLLKKSEHNFKCLIVGGEGDVSVDSLEKKIKEYLLQDNVFYLGKKIGQEKNKIYSESDIFVLPTMNDCFPLVLLEAMQFGKPIISTKIGAIPSIVDNNLTGYIIEPNNHTELYNKLSFLFLNTDICKIFGINAIKKYEKHYTLNIFEKNLNQIIDDILTKK